MIAYSQNKLTVVAEVLYWLWIQFEGLLKHFEGIWKVEVWFLMDYSFNTMLKHLRRTELYFDECIDQESPFFTIANFPFAQWKYFLRHKSIYNQICEMNDSISNIRIDQPTQLFECFHRKILIGEVNYLI